MIGCPYHHNNYILLYIPIAMCNGLQEFRYMISGGEIAKRRMRILASALKKSSKLRILRLTYEVPSVLIDELAVDGLADAIAQLDNLRELYLENYPYELNFLARALPALFKLRVLAVHAIKDSDFEEFCSALRSLVKLQSLTFTLDVISSLGKYLCFVEALSKLTNLEELSLFAGKAVSLLDADTVIFASDLRKLTQLQSLNLDSTPTDRASLVIAQLTNLRELCLENHPNVFNILARALPALSKLQVLTVHAVEYNGFEKFCEALLGLVNLQSLTFELSVISSLGKCSCLVEVLPNLTNLKELSLLDTSARNAYSWNAGINKSFASALGELAQLQKLSLKGVHIDCALSLSACANLQVLDLISCQIADANFLLQKLPSSLRSLKFCHSIRRPGRLNFQSPLPNLQTLILSGNMIRGININTSLPMLREFSLENLDREGLSGVASLILKLMESSDLRCLHLNVLNKQVRWDSFTCDSIVANLVEALPHWRQLQELSLPEGLRSDNIGDFMAATIKANLTNSRRYYIDNSEPPFSLWLFWR